MLFTFCGHTCNGGRRSIAPISHCVVAVAVIVVVVSARATGPEGAQEDPVRLLRAVLTTNTKNAAEAHAEVISSNFWNEGIAGHYSKRAELLESTFSGNGDEHAVIVLLADDTRRAETAFAAASRGDWDSVSSQLSGAGHVHRDATIRFSSRVFYCCSDREVGTPRNILAERTSIGSNET